MNPVGKGSKNQTYAQIVPTNGSRVESYVYWPFDLSAIPENATIDSVSCSVAARMSSVSGTSILTAPIQLFAGSVAKGSATDVYSSMSTDPFSLSTGTWTRAELKTCRLKTGITRNTSNTSSTTYKLYFYGADLTVTYTYQNEKFMLKLSGAYNDVARTFKKVSGIWVEQTDLANVIEDGVRYQNGGEIIPPNPVVNIIGTGHSTNCYATINGVKYTSGAKVSVEPGTVITLTMKGSSSSSMPGAVFVDDPSQPVQDGTSVTYNHTVTNNIVIQFAYTVSGSSYSGMAFILTGVDANVSYFYCTDDGAVVSPFAFREGMTWAEFCNSRYNIPFGATVSGNQIGWSDGRYLADVKPTDVIVAGKTYTRVSSANLISFTIDGTSYQAEEGMTAQEWVDSSYNTGGCMIINNYGLLCLTTSNGRRVLRTDGSNVVAADVIVSGDAYNTNY